MQTPHSASAVRRGALAISLSAALLTTGLGAAPALAAPSTTSTTGAGPTTPATSTTPPATRVLPAEAARMRDRLTRVNASIGVNVGMDLWNETQSALTKLRAAK